MELATVPIVWACRLDAVAYEAAGREVEVPRPSCPCCRRPMVFWSGYWRFACAYRHRGIALPDAVSDLNDEQQ